MKINQFPDHVAWKHLKHTGIQRGIQVRVLAMLINVKSKFSRRKLSFSEDMDGVAVLGVNYFHEEAANHSNQSMTTKVLFVGYNIQIINKLKFRDKRLKYHRRWRMD